MPIERAVTRRQILRGTFTIFPKGGPRSCTNRFHDCCQDQALEIPCTACLLLWRTDCPTPVVQTRSCAGSQLLSNSGSRTPRQPIALRCAGHVQIRDSVAAAGTCFSPHSTYRPRCTPQDSCISKNVNLSLCHGTRSLGVGLKSGG